MAADSEVTTELRSRHGYGLPSFELAFSMVGIVGGAEVPTCSRARCVVHHVRGVRSCKSCANAWSWRERLFWALCCLKHMKTC
eukprot:3659271-Amphidinium_carterae.2